MEPNSLTERQVERIDGAMLLGFGAVGDTFVTVIEDDLTVQQAYHFLEPIAEYRSIDVPKDEQMLSWRAKDECKPRIRKWRSNTLDVPSDVRLSDETMQLLFKLNGAHGLTEDSHFIEVQTPPLDAEGAQRLREALREQDIDSTGGIGVDHIHIEEEEVDVSEYEDCI